MPPPEPNGGHHRGRVIAILIVVLVVIGGVVLGVSLSGGDDDGSGEEEVSAPDQDRSLDDADEDVAEYAEGLGATIAEIDAVDSDAAECIGVVFVEGIGVERLEEDDITPEDFASGPPELFTVSDGELLVSSLKACGVSPRDYFLDGFVDDELGSCLDDRMNDEQMETLLAHAIPNEGYPAEIEQLLGECGMGS